MARGVHHGSLSLCGGGTPCTNPHHILTTKMEPWSFIMSLVLYLSVHMELSLRLSFYLIRSLEGYMLGTTAGFSIKIVEDLATQSCRRILRKCPQYHMSTYSIHH
jgi:hypothetical protein